MNESDSIYSELFSAVFAVKNFSTIVYFGPDELKGSCQLENWLRWTESTIPLLLWSSVTARRLHRFVDAELILLACLPGVYRLDLLRTVSGLLQYLRLSKLVIELPSNEDFQLVDQILQFCYQNHMLNVILILGDFGSSHTLYSFDAYPVYELKAQEFGNDFVELYPDQLMDLKNCTLRTQPDLSDPNTMMYLDEQNNPQILGYVWNMVVEFARKHNARLTLSFVPSVRHRFGHIAMLDMARDGHVDIAASVQPMTMRFLDRYHEYTYPVQIASWCTMLPKENLIELGHFYIWLTPALTIGFLALLWTIYDLLRGRFQFHRRLSSIGWLILAVLLASNFRGRLFSMFIAPPSMAHIDSFAGLSRTKLRIFGSAAEYAGYDFDIRLKYSTLFKLTSNMNEFLMQRNSLNTSYGYTVTYTKWLLYKEMQSRLARPLFYFSLDLCYYQFMPFALVIPENSPHREALDYFLLQLTQSGLFNHWTSKSFDYMNEAGILEIPKLTEPIKVRSLTMWDVRFVLFAYAVGVVIGLIVLVSEVSFIKIKRWLYLY